MKEVELKTAALGHKHPGRAYMVQGVVFPAEPDWVHCCVCEVMHYARRWMPIKTRPLGEKEAEPDYVYVPALELEQRILSERRVHAAEAVKAASSGQTTQGALVIEI